jgi:hypothetical protein
MKGFRQLTTGQALHSALTAGTQSLDPIHREMFTYGTRWMVR